ASISRWSAHLAVPGYRRRLTETAASGDRLLGAQRGERCLSDPPIRERRIGMLPGVGRRPLDLRRGAAEARHRGGLHEACDLDEGLAQRIVRMRRRLAHRQHGRKADVAALHQRAPLVARLAAKELLEALLELGPFAAIE